MKGPTRKNSSAVFELLSYIISEVEAFTNLGLFTMSFDLMIQKFQFPIIKLKPTKTFKVEYNEAVDKQKVSRIEILVLNYNLKGPDQQKTFKNPRDQTRTLIMTTLSPSSLTASLR